ISDFQPVAVSRLGFFSAAFARHSSNGVLAHHQAFKALDGIVNAQAALKSYADIFRYVGVAFLITLPLLFFLDKGKNKAAAASIH
ncbi:MAG: drug resistance transporter, EmrB/QacA subfamily, partial [Pedosphaera sp.]|nr:drug resistance transporter, EmrB/QacA subfamily [Pedosphaera sp.]